MKNELKQRADYHKKRQKGLPALSTLKPDAGDVPTSIKFFNRANGSAGDAGGEGGGECASCGESFNRNSRLNKELIERFAELDRQCFRKNLPYRNFKGTFESLCEELTRDKVNELGELMRDNPDSEIVKDPEIMNAIMATMEMQKNESLDEDLVVLDDFEDRYDDFDFDDFDVFGLTEDDMDEVDGWDNDWAVDAGYSSLVTSAISNAYAYVDELNAIISAFKGGEVDENVISTLEGIANQQMSTVGQLQEIYKQLSPNDADFDDGEIIAQNKILG